MKTKLLYFLLFLLFISSCESNDSDNNEIELENVSKKLLRTEETNRFGVFETVFTYDENSVLTEFNITYTGDDEFIANKTRKVLCYEDNILEGVLEYQDEVLTSITTYKYAEGQLTEEVFENLTTDDDDSKIEYNYDENTLISGFRFYVDAQLQQIVTYTYDNSLNVVLVEDNTDIFNYEFDTSLSPYRNFDPNVKLALTDDDNEVLSKNNITKANLIFNAGTELESKIDYNTIVVVDADNYPEKKTTRQIRNGVESFFKEVIYTYE